MTERITKEIVEKLSPSVDPKDKEIKEHKKTIKELEQFKVDTMAKPLLDSGKWTKEELEKRSSGELELLYEVHKKYTETQEQTDTSDVKPGAPRYGNPDQNQTADSNRPSYTQYNAETKKHEKIYH